MFLFRQLNFIIIFALALAVALFAIQNSEPAIITILPDVQLKAPIVVEFLLAVGLGAVLVWLFSVWTQLQQNLISSQKLTKKILKSKNSRTR